MLETYLFSLDAVNLDTRPFISVLPARVLPSLASTMSNHYIPAGIQQHQPCVVHQFIRRFGGGQREPNSQRDNAGVDPGSALGPSSHA